MPRNSKKASSGHAVAVKGTGAVMKAGNIRKATLNSKREDSRAKKAERRERNRAGSRKQKSSQRTRPAGPVTAIDRDWAVRQTERELITPDIARAYLKRNTNNRPINNDYVLQWKEIILGGEWQTLPQGISFHFSGALADGQHRLMGILLSDKPVVVEVCYGLTDKERDALDQGRKRTAAHIAVIRTRNRGEAIAKYMTQKTAVARQMLNGLGSGPKFASIKTTNNQVHWLETHTDLISDYVETAHATSIRRAYHSGWVAAFCMAALIYGRDKVDPLMRSLHDRSFGSDGDPILALLSLLESPRTRSQRRATAYYAYGVSAIRAALNGQKRTLIKTTLVDFNGSDKLRTEFISRPKGD